MVALLVWLTTSVSSTGSVTFYDQIYWIKVLPKEREWVPHDFDHIRLATCMLVGNGPIEPSYLGTFCMQAIIEFISISICIDENDPSS